MMRVKSLVSGSIFGLSLLIGGSYLRWLRAWVPSAEA